MVISWVNEVYDLEIDLVFISHWELIVFFQW